MDEVHSFVELSIWFPKHTIFFLEIIWSTINSDITYDAWQNAVILWSYDPPERHAGLAKDALKAKKKGTKHLQVLVEIACASTPNHLVAVRQAYCSLFDCSLEEDIIASVAPPLKKVRTWKFLRHTEQKHLALSRQA